MSTDSSETNEPPLVRRDGPWLVAESTVGDVRILAGEPPVMSGFLDVEVASVNGRRFLTVGTLDDIAEAMTRWKTTGESLDGRYLCISDLVVVASTDVRTIVEVVDHLASTGDLDRSFTLPDD